MIRARFSAACFLAALFLLCAGRPADAQNRMPDAQADAPPLILYSGITATTPQVPFWAAVKAGWPHGRTIEARYWKNLDDLRGLLLAGKGDIWVGSLETFAQAARRGAPVSLLAVTSWKKFYLVTTGNAVTIDELAQELRDTGQALTVAPADSPALAVLADMARRGGPSFQSHALPTQQAMLELLRGSVKHALLPEPVVSILLARNPALRRADSLEAAYGRLVNGPPRLPLIGIAVNSALPQKSPELVDDLLQAMQTRTARLENDPAAALSVLPKEALGQADMEILLESMRHDLLLALPAAEVEAEIAEYLRIIAQDNAAPLPPDFIYRPKNRNQQQ